MHLVIGITLSLHRHSSSSSSLHHRYSHTVSHITSAFGHVHSTRIIPYPHALFQGVFSLTPGQPPIPHVQLQNLATLHGELGTDLTGEGRCLRYLSYSSYSIYCGWLPRSPSPQCRSHPARCPTPPREFAYQPRGHVCTALTTHVCVQLTPHNTNTHTHTHTDGTSSACPPIACSPLHTQSKGA